MSILFFISDFERGGIPRVTLNLARLLMEDGKKVGVMYGNSHGMFYKQFRDSGCTMISGGGILRAMMCNLKKETGCFLLLALCVKILRRLLKSIIGVDLFLGYAKRAGRLASKLGYDVIVATSEGIPLQWLGYVNEGKRLLWIHNDYAHEQPENYYDLRKAFMCVDKIVCVAEHVRKAFLSYFPEVEYKTISLHNAVNDEEVVRLAYANDVLDERFSRTPFSILSIGRFNERPKHFSAIPKIAAELNKRGCLFRWYIIGSGSSAETAILYTAIHQFHMEDLIILLGEKSNPYPFLAQCSLFALTSRYEAYPSVLNEALVLGTPIITTDFEGVRELVNESNACICPIEFFADQIQKLTESSKLIHPVDFTHHNAVVLEQFKKIALP